jgi:hypothetical protein
LAPLEPDLNAWGIRGRLNSLERCMTEIRGARNIVSKAKRFPRISAMGTTALRALTPIRDQWREALNEREAIELHERQLSELHELHAWLAEGKPENVAWRVRDSLTRADLWPLAISENMPDVAQAIGEAIQTRELRAEYEARFPTPRRYYDEKLTAAQWYAGKGSAHATIEGDDYFTTRVRRKGEHLETSRGAIVPFRSAVRAFMFAQLCRAKGEAWARNGHKVPVGPYQLDAINEAGNIKAGCHTLLWDEMLDCAVREIPSEVRATFPVPACRN